MQKNIYQGTIITKRIKSLLKASTRNPLLLWVSDKLFDAKHRNVSLKLSVEKWYRNVVRICVPSCLTSSGPEFVLSHPISESALYFCNVTLGGGNPSATHVKLMLVLFSTIADSSLKFHSTVAGSVNYNTNKKKWRHWQASLPLKLWL